MANEIQKIVCPGCNEVVRVTTEYGTTSTCRLHAVAPRMLKLIREVSQWVTGPEMVDDALSILRDIEGQP